MIDEQETLLAKTQRELEELKREYHEFAYIVSHDLSAPFRQIEGFSKILAKRHADMFDEKSTRHFDLIISGSATGKESLNALLEYSRLNTEPDPFVSLDCNKIVKDVEVSLGAMIAQSSAQINYLNLPVITAGGKQTLTLFHNLIENALLFQEKGSTPEISIEVEEKDSAWQFCVKDNGIGIPENLTPKIFKALRRAVSKDDYPGLGMGLAIARKIVRRHGGEVWVETDKGVGSAFYFTIAKSPM